MAQRMKALKEKQSGNIVYIFSNPSAAFSSPEHELVIVEVKEIQSSMCAMCTAYDKCASGLKGNDFDCSSYTTDPQPA